MTMARQSKYVTYLRGSREGLWQTLKQPEFASAYAAGCLGNGNTDPWAPSAGEVHEIDYPRLLVLSCRDQSSRAIFEMEEDGDTVQVTVTHEFARERPPVEARCHDWPNVLSSLKSYLETGHAGVRHA
jgi:uncharacterized protein YndB with AHSA1/START domain